MVTRQGGVCLLDQLDDAARKRSGTGWHSSSRRKRLKGAGRVGQRVVAPEDNLLTHCTGTETDHMSHKHARTG